MLRQAERKPSPLPALTEAAHRNGSWWRGETGGRTEKTAAYFVSNSIRFVSIGASSGAVGGRDERRGGKVRERSCWCAHHITISLHSTLYLSLALVITLSHCVTPHHCLPQYCFTVSLFITLHHSSSLFVTPHHSLSLISTPSHCITPHHCLTQYCVTVSLFITLHHSLSPLITLNDSSLYHSSSLFLFL